jgi:hypothetical protein
MVNASVIYRGTKTASNPAAGLAHETKLFCTKAMGNREIEIDKDTHVVCV